MSFCSYVLRVSGKSYRAHILLSIRFMVVNTICFSTKVKCCKGNTEALHPSKKVYNLYTNICPLPVIPLIKECVRFYCHLTLFVRNRLIHRDFKSVRWFQSILHTPATSYTLHPAASQSVLSYAVGLTPLGRREICRSNRIFCSPMLWYRPPVLVPCGSMCGV